MTQQEPVYLLKAVESLEGAMSELSNRRYQNSVSRSYYACFQAAVYALLGVGLVPPSDSATWSHKSLQSLFASQLIAQRKLFPSELRSVLPANYMLREVADYSDDLILSVQAERAARRARRFVEAIQRQGGGMV